MKLDKKTVVSLIVGAVLAIVGGALVIWSDHAELGIGLITAAMTALGVPRLGEPPRPSAIPMETILPPPPKEGAS